VPGSAGQRVHSREHVVVDTTHVRMLRFAGRCTWTGVVGWTGVRLGYDGKRCVWGWEATQRSPREKGAPGAVCSHAPRTRSSGIPLDQADWLARSVGGRVDANGSDNVRTEKDPSVNPIEQRSPRGASPVPGVREGHALFLGDDIAKGPPQLELLRLKPLLPGASPVPGVREGHDTFLGDDIAKGPPQLELLRLKPPRKRFP
jgi:hypothetical protein